MFSLSIMALSDRHTSARIGDAFFKGVCYFFALAVILLMVLILIVLFKESWLSIKTFGFKFFYSTARNPVRSDFGRCRHIQHRDVIPDSYNNRPAREYRHRDILNGMAPKGLKGPIGSP